MNSNSNINRHFEIAALNERIRLLEHAIDIAPIGILLFNGQNQLIHCNAEKLHLLDYPLETLEPQKPTLEKIIRIIESHGEQSPEEIETSVKNRLARFAEGHEDFYQCQRPNGKMLNIRITPLKNGGAIINYSENPQNQMVADQSTNHDQLTGLPNRTLLFDRLKIALASTNRGQSIALHYVVLDNFKTIHKQFGNGIGNLVLKKISSTLLRTARETDTVARIENDVFVIIQSEVCSISDANSLAERALKNIHETVIAEDLSIEINATIGIAFAPWDSDQGEELLGKAILAMSHDKKHAKGKISYFSKPEQLDKLWPGNGKLNPQFKNNYLYGDVAS
jgi:diguanylate cyclase (GGDEF)-like protein